MKSEFITNYIVSSSLLWQYILSFYQASFDLDFCIMQLLKPISNLVYSSIIDATSQYIVPDLYFYCANLSNALQIIDRDFINDIVKTSLVPL